MFRYITPIILVGIAIAGFFFYAKPLLGDISVIKSEMASYNEALDNAKTLENERDKLTKKFNAIDPDNLSRLEKLLPENVDNIRLILEIEKIALPYGMALKDVKYDATLSSKKNEKGSIEPKISGALDDEANKEYGEWTLEFSTEGKYNDFLSFLRDMESNLRIVDIDTITFSSDNTSGAVVAKTKSPDLYRYGFKIKTYWLKN